jgi:hypothetical protein
MHRLKIVSTNSFVFTADGKVFSFLFNLHLLERFETLLDNESLKPMLVSSQTLTKFFSQSQGQKVIEDMSCDIRIIVIDECDCCSGHRV